MVSLNITNVPRPLYQTLQEIRGKIHANTWIQVLQYLVQDPEGEVDIDFLSINGQPVFDDRGRPIFTKKIVFRTGTFVHEFDPMKPHDERFTLIHMLTAPAKSRYREIGFNGKDH